MKGNKGEGQNCENHRKTRTNKISLVNYEPRRSPFASPLTSPRHYKRSEKCRSRSGYNRINEISRHSKHQVVSGTTRNKPTAYEEVRAGLAVEPPAGQRDRDGDESSLGGRVPAVGGREPPIAQPYPKDGVRAVQDSALDQRGIPSPQPRSTAAPVGAVDTATRRGGEAITAAAMRRCHVRWPAALRQRQPAIPSDWPWYGRPMQPPGERKRRLPGSHMLTSPPGRGWALA